MEQIGTAAENGRRGTIFAQEAPAADHSHLKTEIVLMQRKYERLLQKERRMIVSLSKEYFIVTVCRLLKTLSLCVCLSVPLLWLTSRLLWVRF